MSGRVTDVERFSPADRAGIVPGDVVMSANGREIRDVLDYKFYTYDAELSLKVRSKDARERDVFVKKIEGQDLGLSFETYLMDDMRSCVNRCIFCFVDQMPPGLRESLYVKDDDSRLSFLLGNYVTLTNMSERDFQRIIDMKISPLCVSVHATEPDLRRVMLGIRGAGRGYDQLCRLARAGIELHCQIVVCSGYNDGAALEKTLGDLCALRPAVTSISVIPVGLTRWREGLCELRPLTKEDAVSCIELCGRFAAECLKESGSRVVYCSDEMYLRAGIGLPEYEEYEQFEQLENGVGLLRLLEHEFLEALQEDGIECSGAPFSVATGEAAAPFIERLAAAAKEKYSDLNVSVHAVRNELFGRSVDVAGLVTGRDLIGQLKGQDLGTRLLIPDVMLRSGEDVFLDGISVSQVSSELGVPVIPVKNDGYELLDTFLEG
ncbi:MAG: DUF512 domain-containing protein [Clostridiales bacterium]|jgi:putative radical SAM enzyme (TIGR03279 family)|nr:DUF512 domain-containing protein [Clostridiales bacterium]